MFYRTASQGNEISEPDKEHCLELITGNLECENQPFATSLARVVSFGKKMVDNWFLTLCINKMFSLCESVETHHSLLFLSKVLLG